jgi:hypothetical protein
MCRRVPPAVSRQGAACRSVADGDRDGEPVAFSGGPGHLDRAPIAALPFPAVPDFATLYLGNASPLPLDFLQRMAPSARVSTLPPGGGIAGGYLIEAPAWRLRLSAMPPEHMPANLQGFSGWIATVGGPSSPAAPRLQQHIHDTKLVVGCVGEPAFDPSGYARRTITAIARPGKGLIFAQGVYDHDGALLLGPPGTPARFLPSELSPPQRWTLATTAIVTRYFEHSHELLGGMLPGAESAAEAKDSLADPWGISTRRELQDMLKHLADPGVDERLRDLGARITAGTARPTDDVSAEDIEYVRTFGAPMIDRARVADYHCRRVYLAGLGFLAGHLSESEAWGYALASAHRLQQTFQSWEDLGASYLMGMTWRRGPDDELMESYGELMADTSGPWHQIPWALALG